MRTTNYTDSARSAVEMRAIYWYAAVLLAAGALLPGAEGQVADCSQLLATNSDAMSESAPPGPRMNVLRALFCSVSSAPAPCDAVVRA